MCTFQLHIHMHVVKGKNCFHFLRIKGRKNFFVHKLKLKVMKISQNCEKKPFKLTDFVKIGVLHSTTIISSDVVQVLFH